MVAAVLTFAGICTAVAGPDKPDLAFSGAFLLINLCSPNSVCEAAAQPTDREAFAKMLRDRVATLGRIESGLQWRHRQMERCLRQRQGDSCGQWRISRRDRRRWLAHSRDRAGNPAQTDRGWKGRQEPPGSKPGPLPAIRLRHQDETLRVVVDEGDTRTNTKPHYCNVQPVTASYFASGPADPAAAADKIDTTFVTPTFDCTYAKQNLKGM